MVNTKPSFHQSCSFHHLQQPAQDHCKSTKWVVPSHVQPAVAHRLGDQRSKGHPQLQETHCHHCHCRHLPPLQRHYNRMNSFVLSSYPIHIIDLKRNWCSASLFLLKGDVWCYFTISFLSLIWHNWKYFQQQMIIIEVSMCCMTCHKFSLKWH